jgi:hypothetical protein
MVFLSVLTFSISSFVASNSFFVAPRYQNNGMPRALDDWGNVFWYDGFSGEGDIQSFIYTGYSTCYRYV